MNCPIIVSNKGSIVEVGKNIIDYFDPYSIEDMISGIEKLVFDEKRKIDMINEYPKHLLDFTWQNTTRLTEKVYEELL